MTSKIKCITWAAVGLLAASAAQAQSAGSWLLRAGVMSIQPHVESGDLTAPSQPGTKADIDSDTQLAGGITYMVTDHFAIDVPLALPFKHDLVGAGAIEGVGKIGEVKVVPVTVLGQYRFLPAQSKIRPYAKAGVTYARFYKARGTATLSGLTGGTPADPTTLKVDSKFGITVGLGASAMLGERWFVDGHVAKTFLKTRNTLSTGQTLDLKVDPTSLALALGYRF